MTVLAAPAPDPSPPVRVHAPPLGVLGWTALAITLLVGLPIAVVLSHVFAPGESSWSHLVHTVLPGYVLNTLGLMFGVTAGVASMGVLSAWLVTAYRFPGRGLLEWTLLLPLAMPAYVMAYAYTDWLQFAGPVQSALRAVTGWQVREYWFPDVRSLPGAIAMFSFALYPYVYLLARTAFFNQSRTALEAGRLLGYGSWGSFFRVALPLARPAVAAGVALALMETLADFGTVSYFAVQTFTTGIFRAWQSLQDKVAAAQLAACLLGFVALVLLAECWSRGRARYHNTAPRSPLPPQRLRGAAAGLAFAACAAPVVLGFLLPAGILLKLALTDPEARWTARIAALAFNSFTLAGVTAVVTVGIAIVLAYAGRLTRRPLVVFANRAAGLGYAMPGAVIAVGILFPLGRLDNLLADWVYAQFGVRMGLLLTGTIVALVYAYVVRFLAIALQSMDAGLTRITPSMEDAARSLGATPAGTLARVHAPMLSGSLMTAALLVFVDVMKELPATFALRPFNFDTLAIEAYNLTRDERLAEAAMPALLIVAVGLVPLIVMSLRMARERR